MSEFVHLHVHSEYSLLDGLSRLKDLSRRAHEMGMHSLAITDHGAMYGIFEFLHAVEEYGIKPIIGCEVYLAPRRMQQKDPKRDARPYHLVLLAENQTGYQNLITLVTKSHLDGYYYKPRVDKPLLAKHAEGLIALSACASGEIPRLILQGKADKAREAAIWYRDTFGGKTDSASGFYLELQKHEGMPELDQVNAELIVMSRSLGIPLVATNDVHYIEREDASAQELLLCIQTNTTINDPKRMQMGSKDYHLRSPDEMAALFVEVPEALKNTLLIAERCSVNLNRTGYHLPPFDVPEGHTAQSYLRHLSEEGLRRHYGQITDEIRERLNYELGLVHHMGFDSYFLIVWDLVRYAKTQGILVGPGRGSGAASIVAYALGITALDPLQHGLLFERFLNPGRVTMPDIDLDFADDRRDELIRYAVQKYGQDRVAQIITFGTMAARAAIRDAGRALDIPLPEIDRVAKMVPFGPKVQLQDALEPGTPLRALYDQEDYVRDWIDKAIALEGIARHVSTHAAGVVIGDKPLVEYLPLQRAPDGQGTLSMYSMEVLEEIGLLKIDFLGLSTLTILQRAMDLVREKHGKRLTLEDIPLDDPAIYRLLCTGEVTGLFQLESAGMRRVLRDLQPSNFEDVVVLLSLYRPGPMQFIPNYINRKHGREPIEYPHPAMEPILKETFGVLVYQEQILRMARDLAGYSIAEADLMRRAVGKKKEKELEAHQEKFIAGAMQRGLSREDADQIFQAISYFANYGFNKPHSAAYAVLTCQTAYLKAKYPVEYMAALLSVERNNTEKIGALIAECRRMGIEILPPDVNQSELDFTIEYIPESEAKSMVDNGTLTLPEGVSGRPAIRFGLGAIKNVGEGPLQAILEGRKKTTSGKSVGETKFTSIDDFCQRVDLRQVNKRVLECLIKAGAMDCFGGRAQLLEVMDRMLAYSHQCHEARAAGQHSFFDLEAFAGSGGPSLFYPLPRLDPIPSKKMLTWEKELLGAYISEHPLQALARLPAEAITSDQIDSSLKGQVVQVAGMVTDVRVITTRNDKPMAFVQLEDLHSTIEVVVFPNTYEETAELWEEDSILVVKGRVDVRADAGGDGAPKLICQAVDEYAPDRASVLTANRPDLANRPKLLHITFHRTNDLELDRKRLTQVCQLLESFRGDDRYDLCVISPMGVVRMEFPNYTTKDNPELRKKLTSLLGQNALQVDWATE